MRRASGAEGLNTVAALARVCVVTVAYNSASALRGMLGSLPPGLGVIVVDNASADDSAAMAEGAGARVIRNGANLGFGAGCNIGMAAAATEFVLLANPDTETRGLELLRQIAVSHEYDTNHALLYPAPPAYPAAPTSRWERVTDRPALRNQSASSSARATDRCLPPVQPTAIVR